MTSKRAYIVILFIMIAGTICCSCSRGQLNAQSYIGFRFGDGLEELYEGEAFEAGGREHDSLWIFRYEDVDGSFEKHIVNEGWQCLPLPDNVRESETCDIEYCPEYMERLVNTTEGYYLFEEGLALHSIFVYDTENHILYIRRATYFCRDNWPVTGK